MQCQLECVKRFRTQLSKIMETFGLENPWDFRCICFVLTGSLQSRTAISLSTVYNDVHRFSLVHDHQGESVSGARLCQAYPK